jgi:hypothetical protein
VTVEYKCRFSVEWLIDCRAPFETRPSLRTEEGSTGPPAPALPFSTFGDRHHMGRQKGHRKFHVHKHTKHPRTSMREDDRGILVGPPSIDCARESGENTHAHTWRSAQGGGDAPRAKRPPGHTPDGDAVDCAPRRQHRSPPSQFSRARQRRSAARTSTDREHNLCRVGVHRRHQRVCARDQRWKDRPAHSNPRLSSSVRRLAIP